MLSEIPEDMRVNLANYPVCIDLDASLGLLARRRVAIEKESQGG